MNAAAYPECGLCGFRHGPGPCIVPVVLPPGVDGAMLGAKSPRIEAARRTGRISSARQHERSVTRKEAKERQRLRAIKRAADLRYGLEKAAQRDGSAIKRGSGTLAQG